MVESASYTNEAELQRLLAESPSLVSISEIRAGADPLVVTVREIGLPGSGNTDVIGFSASGDIAIVECKLASNAEIKRKVIGQVLEYGAYLWGMAYDELDQRIQARRGLTLADLVREAVGNDDWDEEAFRSGVAEALANGTFVLLIAVDEMNDELTRTVNFLNNCGNPAFAFAALEMRRFQRGTTEILVPGIIGTSLVPKKNKVMLSKRWEEDTFSKAIQRLPEEITHIIKDIYAWTIDEADQVEFGRGKDSGAFRFKIKHQEQAVSVFHVRSDGRLIITFGALSSHFPAELVVAFGQGIGSIPSLAEIASDVKKWPSIGIDDAFLDQPGALDRFKAAVLDLKRRASSQTP